MRRCFSLGLCALLLLCGCRVCWGAAGQISIMPGYALTPSTSVTGYASFDSINLATGATESQNQCVSPASFSITGMLFFLPTAPGGSASWTISVRDTTTATTTTVATITGAATTATYSGTINVAAGDLIDLQVTPSGTPAATATIAWCSQRQMSSGSGTLWMARNSTTIAATTTDWVGCQTTSGPSTLEESVAFVCPTAGTIGPLYVATDAAPTTTGTTVTLRLASQTLTGTAIAPSSQALTCTVGTGTQAASDTTTGHYIAVTAGQRVDWQIAVAGGTAMRVMVSAVFVPTTAGECVHLFGVGEAANTNQFNWGNAITATEINRQMPFYACTIKKLWLVAMVNGSTTNAGIAATQTSTITLRSGATGALSPSTLLAIVTGNGSGVSNETSDTSDTLPVTAGQYVDYSNVTSLSSGTVAARYGFVMLVTQPGGAAPLFRRTSTNPRAGSRGAALFHRTRQEGLCFAH